MSVPNGSNMSMTWFFSKERREHDAFWYLAFQVFRFSVMFTFGYTTLLAKIEVDRYLRMIVHLISVSISKVLEEVVGDT